MANSGVIIGSTIAGVAIIFAIFISLNPITSDSESGLTVTNGKILKN